MVLTWGVRWLRAQSVGSDVAAELTKRLARRRDDVTLGGQQAALHPNQLALEGDYPTGDGPDPRQQHVEQRLLEGRQIEAPRLGLLLQQGRGRQHGVSVESRRRAGCAGPTPGAAASWVAYRRGASSRR